MSSSFHRFPLFRLSLTGLATRGSCWLLLAGAVVFTWLLPLITPWEENPVLLQPARAQAAWIYAWLVLLTWLPFQAAALGQRLRREGWLEHFRAAGTGPCGLWLQASAAVALWLAAVVVVVCGLCLLLAMPARPEEARLWVGLVAQYGALYLVCGLPLVLLALALGTLTVEVVAFLVPAGLLFTGLAGALWLAPLLGGAQSGVLQGLWLALPHYHLADLTPRLVFKMGPLPWADFQGVALALSLQGLALCLPGLCLFRTRS